MITSEGNSINKSIAIAVMLIALAIIGGGLAQPAFAGGETQVFHDLQISGLYVIDFRILDVWPDRVEFFKNQKVTYIRNKTDFNEAVWVNLKMKLDQNWAAYARIDQTYAQYPNIFTVDQSRYVKGGDKSAGYMDMYGLTYTNKTTTANIGRQDFKLGPLGMLADSTLTIGDTNVIGVSVLTKQGKMTWNSLYVSQVDENTPRNYENKIWSVGASYAANKNITFGGYYASKRNANAALNWGSTTADYTEVNFSYKDIVPKVSFVGEVGWTKNDPFVSGLPASWLITFPSGTIKSYIYQFSYQMDRKNVLKVGTSSVPFLSGMSALAPKANFINFQHFVSKQEMVELYYKDGKYELPTAFNQIYGAGPYPERHFRITYWHQF